MTTKVCHACKCDKDAKDFYKSSSSKDGLAPSCKDCQNGRTVPKKETTRLEPEKAKVNVVKVMVMEKYAERKQPEESNGLTVKLMSKMWVWWFDLLRNKIYHGHPRAGEIININYDTGTALVSFYSDSTANRTKETKLANISDLKHRQHHY